MGKKAKTAIVPTREENYAEWYQQVIKLADLAENSEVRGCMIIKPWGYAIWENIQKHLDKMFKDTGHKNAYFPIFIPKSFLEKEAEHVEGFAKECAVVTHSRLEDDGKGGLKVAGELAEPYIVRPTSETIIGDSFARWVNSYRDLPLLINQWANVVRWELRTRLFLRTAEFLWQEGHTAHATELEARDETKKMLDVYAEFAEKYLAIPVYKGEKSESERFPGAVATFCIEAMMQDKKALQAGTTHFLGQNFAKASGIRFQNKDGEMEYAWTTSWGVSTRLIGALIMAHSDDNGMVIPPRVAPAHVAIIPIIKDSDQEELVMDYVTSLRDELKDVVFDGRNIEVELDTRDMTFSERSWDWIKHGIPIRIELGIRDIENDSIYFGRRDMEPKEKVSMQRTDFITSISSILADIQNNYYDRALCFRNDNTVEFDDKKEFYKFFTLRNPNTPKIHGGFASAHWCGSPECEEKIKGDLKVTIRCIPEDAKGENGFCINCGAESKRRVLFAKSY